MPWQLERAVRVSQHYVDQHTCSGTEALPCLAQAADQPRAASLQTQALLVASRTIAEVESDRPVS